MAGIEQRFAFLTGSDPKIPAYHKLGTDLLPIRKTFVRVLHPITNLIVISMLPMDFINNSGIEVAGTASHTDVSAGVHLGVLYTACLILSENTEGFISKKRDRTEAISEAFSVSDPDQLITPGDYYFHAKEITKVEYTVNVEFEEYVFPHNSLPKFWVECRDGFLPEGEHGSEGQASRFEEDVKRRDEFRCVISGWGSPLETAHIIPKDDSSSSWFIANYMWNYLPAPNIPPKPDDKRSLNSLSNGLSLREDLHSLFDKKTFLLAPKNRVLVPHFLRKSTTAHYYHNVPLALHRDSINIEFAFARFAWTILRNKSQAKTPTQIQKRKLVITDSPSLEKPYLLNKRNKNDETSEAPTAQADGSKTDNKCRENVQSLASLCNAPEFVSVAEDLKAGSGIFKSQAIEANYMCGHDSNIFKVDCHCSSQSKYACDSQRNCQQSGSPSGGADHAQQELLRDEQTSIHSPKEIASNMVLEREATSVDKLDPTNNQRRLEALWNLFVAKGMDEEERDKLRHDIETELRMNILALTGDKGREDWRRSYAYHRLEVYPGQEYFQRLRDEYIQNHTNVRQTISALESGETSGKPELS